MKNLVPPSRPFLERSSASYRQVLQRIFSIGLVCCYFMGCSTSDTDKDTAIDVSEPTEEAEQLGPYLGMVDTDTARLLAPDLIASSIDEYNSTFSPDGKLFFFTTNTPRDGIICFTEMNEDGSWSEVKVAPFSGEYSEYDPLFAPDGNRLYFSSERPINDTAEAGQSNIWFVEKEGTGWSEPTYIPLTESADYHSSITNDGSIYFNVWDNGDMWKATISDTGYTIERLPDVVNSTNGEGDPFIAPNEEYMIYRGYNNSLGRGDMYITFNINGNWTAPENLGPRVNSSSHEMCPFVTADGKYFLFASSRLLSTYDPQASQSIENVRAQHRSANNGQLNVFYINASFIDSMKAQHVAE